MAEIKRENKPPQGGFGRPGRGPMHFGPKEKAKNAKGTLVRLLGYLSERKITLTFVLIFCVVSSLITILGTRINGLALDNYIAKKDLHGLMYICLILLGMYAVNVCISYYQNLCMIHIAQKTSAKIRSELFASLEKIPMKFFDTHSGGDLMSRLTNDVDNINNTLSQSVTQLFSGIINVLGTFVAMIILSPYLTIVSLITTPLVFITTKTIAKVSRKYFKQTQNDLGELNGYVEEMISGQKVVKLFSREESSIKEFEEINNRYKHSNAMAQIVSGVMGPSMNVINNISYLLTTIVGAILYLNDFPDITVGLIFSFILYMKNFSRPLNEIANLFNTIQSALAGAERVFEIMDEEKEEDIKNAKEAKNIKGDVSIENVDFSYVQGKKILKNANIYAKSGEQIAIVGPTGAGKTTIISLLTKFYEIDSGRILIDGENINNYKRESIRKSIGMVLQDTYLFSETIMENIRYGKPDATDEMVINAAKTANAHSFIKHLKNGYQTVLSDNGSDISQGQRQLLAIARAILTNPQMLILDEATSSVDTNTEKKINEALSILMKGRTTFIIAHRLSTIKNADKILVLNHGVIEEQGTHNELLEKKGFYYNLYNTQFKTGIVI